MMVINTAQRFLPQRSTPKGSDTSLCGGRSHTRECTTLLRDCVGKSNVYWKNNSFLPPLSDDHVLSKGKDRSERVSGWRVVSSHIVTCFSSAAVAFVLRLYLHETKKA